MCLFNSYTRSRKGKVIKNVGNVENLIKGVNQKLKTEEKIKILTHLFKIIIKLDFTFFNFD